MNRGACHLSAWFRAHPQRGQPSCVGEEMDGSRTHRCHRRCGHGGQPPPARCCGRSCLWTTPWMARGQGRGSVGDGWSSPAPRCPAQSVHRFVLRHLWVTECRLSGIPRSAAGGQALESVCCVEMCTMCGHPWAKVWTATWRSPESRDSRVPTRVSTGWGHVDEGGGRRVRLRGHDWVSRRAQLGRSLWTTRHEGLPRSTRGVGPRRREAPVGGQTGQPACCLMRLVSSVTWL